MTIKCASCGRFIPYSEMGPEGRAVFNFTPSSNRSDEESEWICGRCNTPESVNEPARFGSQPGYTMDDLNRKIRHALIAVG